MASEIDDVAPRETRLERFGVALAELGIGAAVVNHPTNLYYLAGTAQPCNLLVVPGQPPVLFARRFAELAAAETWIEEVVPGRGFAAVAARLPAELRRGSGVLAMELDVVPASLYLGAKRAFGPVPIEDCGALLARQRAVKDRAEIARLGAAAEVFEAVHRTLVEVAAPGRTELEVAAEMERTLRAAGCEGRVVQRRWDARLAPEGNVASGPNLSVVSGGPVTISGVGLGAAFPFGASRRRLEPGDLLNVDLGINLAGYHADAARTYSLGEPDAELRRLAVAMREIQDRVLELVLPGAVAEEVYEGGLAAAAALGVDDFFQGFGEVRGPYVGHGIGLELDEWPVLGPGERAPLAPGMVLAIEPKLISPTFGGMNIEDDVVVADRGAELLTTVPRSLFVLADGSAEPITP